MTYSVVVGDLPILNANATLIINNGDMQFSNAVPDIVGNEEIAIAIVEFQGADRILFLVQYQNFSRIIVISSS